MQWQPWLGDLSYLPAAAPAAATDSVDQKLSVRMWLLLRSDSKIWARHLQLVRNLSCFGQASVIYPLLITSHSYCATLINSVPMFQGWFKCSVLASKLFGVAVWGYKHSISMAGEVSLVFLVISSWFLLQYAQYLICNAMAQNYTFLNIIFSSEELHGGNDPARQILMLKMIYHSLSKDQHFCTASKDWPLPCKPHYFKKKWRKPATIARMALPPVQVHACWWIQCHMHCLNIMKIMSSSLRHRSKKLSSPGFACQTTLPLIVMLLRSSEQRLDPCLFLQFCSLGATLLLLWMR